MTASNDLGNKAPIFGIGQNPVAPCLLLVTVLFRLFVLSRRFTALLCAGAGELDGSTTLALPDRVPTGRSTVLSRRIFPVEIQISGKTDPKNISSVSQHAAAALAEGERASAGRPVLLIIN